MKKVIGFGLVMLLAVPAMAQFMGLPVAGGGVATGWGIPGIGRAGAR